MDVSVGVGVSVGVAVSVVVGVAEGDEVTEGVNGAAAVAEAVRVSNGIGVPRRVPVGSRDTFVSAVGVNVDSTAPTVTRLVTVTIAGGKVGIWPGAS